MRHTPGPWTVISGSKKLDYWIQGPIVNEDEFRDICSLSTWDSDERIKANAHLIATAPDLLKLLKETLSSERSDCNDRNCGLCTRCKSIMAIAKAERREEK